MLGSCIGVAVLAMLYEGLKVLRELIDAKCGCRRPHQPAVGCDRGQESSNSSINKSSSTNECNADVHQ